MCDSPRKVGWGIPVFEGEPSGNIGAILQARLPTTGLERGSGRPSNLARLIGDVCQRRDDVALVARSLANATANRDRDGAPYIDLRKVSAPDGLEQVVVRHSPIVYDEFWLCDVHRFVQVGSRRARLRHGVLVARRGGLHSCLEYVSEPR
jgi:hypothetical protein